MPTQGLEKFASRLAAMDRQGIIRLINGMRCDFRLDFSEEFLNSVSLERLRHIALAASLHSREIAS